MKIIITESHFKNTIFKYFDKFGGEIDTLFIDTFRVDRNDPIVNYDQVYKYLIEWRGEEESKELAKTLLLHNPHHIDDFGGYDFFFEVVDIDYWELDASQPKVVVNVKVDDLGGETTLIGYDGETYKLSDALGDKEYGWEVRDEVDWAINDYFKDNITTKTGINIIYHNPEYTSKN